MKRTGGGSMRLNYLSVWSDDNHEVAQVIYEDSDTGDTYIQRTTEEAEAVTVVTISGLVSTISSSEFEVLKRRDC